jgi:hypothetical protein
MKTRELANIGILEIIETQQGEMLSLSNAQIVRIWGEMRKAGSTAISIIRRRSGVLRRSSQLRWALGNDIPSANRRTRKRR